MRWNSEMISVAGLSLAEEAMGSREKFWVRKGSERFLCKLVRELNGEPFGEDWSEWLSAVTGELLGLPTASIRPIEIDLRNKVRRGILSANFVRPEEELINGNQLLGGLFPGYGEQGRFESLYTVDAVSQALSTAEPPENCSIPDLSTAFEVWAGYVTLDALISGVDRHHENWAAIRTESGLRLAPSFDHGNSFGVYESDHRISAYGGLDGVTRWVERGKSRFWGAPPLIDVVNSAFRLVTPAARESILERVAALDTIKFQDAVESIPDSTMPANRKQFASNILLVNRERILNGC